MATNVNRLDPLLRAVGHDPWQGIEIITSGQLCQKQPLGDTAALILPVHNAREAQVIQAQLLQVFPADHPVQVLQPVDEDGYQAVPCRLRDIGGLLGLQPAEAVFLPPLESGTRPTMSAAMTELVRVIERLRGPGGCPWDREQTHITLRPYMLEEAYETVEAIDTGNPKLLCSELGDVLLQVVFHAQLGREAETFDVVDVITGLTDKLIRRHPHVFGDIAVSGAAEVVRNWEAIKAREQEAVPKAQSALDEVAKALPALSRAQKIQAKAARVGFDWPDVEGPLKKLDEELGELRAALHNHDDRGLREELGDLLFAVVNVARILQQDPEVALTSANAKFMRRFEYVESEARRQGRDLQTMNLEQMDTLWTQAKQLE